MAERKPYRAGFDHRWHVAINAHAQAAGFDGMRFMYEAKTLFQEVPRLRLLFAMERAKTLPTEHVQCRMCSPSPQPVVDNKLTCCLGVVCRECPHLLAIESGDLSDDEKNLAKAVTCATHIVSEGGDVANEGFITTDEDRMFWEGVYRSLSQPEPPMASEEENTT